MNVQIEASWKRALADEFQKPYFEALRKKIREEYLTTVVYPPPQSIFNAFSLCPFDDVRVVILGQDPYHGPHQAHGLAFSVEDAVPIPPSLKNIYKEIHSDIGTLESRSGNLERWATQGVLLLNNTLTVRQGQPNSHHDLGWEQFTDAVIRKLSQEHAHLVFLLWGKMAQVKGGAIDCQKHLVLTAPHPSPLSAHTGFFGCRHFSKTNQYLLSHQKTPIVW